MERTTSLNNKQILAIIPKFRIGDVIRHKTGLCPAFKIDRIVNMHYIGFNNESVNIAVQDNWEIVE